MGQKESISKVVLNWEAAYGKTVEIQVSNDAKEWKNVGVIYDGDGGIDEVEFAKVSARYVRVYGLERATGYGYSLWELEVY